MHFKQISAENWESTESAALPVYFIGVIYENKRE